MEGGAGHAAASCFFPGVCSSTVAATMGSELPLAFQRLENTPANLPRRLAPPDVTAVGLPLASAPPAQKAFQRELSKVLQASDILVEVLDARDPLGCRCKPLEDAVMQKWQSSHRESDWV